MANNKHNEDLIEQIKHLIDKGYNVTNIGRELGLSHTTVSNWCKKLNIPIVKKIGNQNSQKHKIFIEEIKQHGIVKIASQKAGIKSNGAYLIKMYDLQEYIIGRSQPKLSIEDVQKRLPNQNDKVIGFEKGKYTIQSEQGDVFHKKASKVFQGNPRGKCGSPTKVEEVESALKKLDYTYLHGFKSNIKRSIVAEHNVCGHIRETRLEAFERQDCATCANIGKSKQELELREFLQNILPNVYIEMGNRKILKGKELDVYIPSLNLAIEYCGLYWHNENSPHPRSKEYHASKMQKCEELGIRLITIFEDEWVYRGDQVKSFLKSVVGFVEERFYARNSYARVISQELSSAFLEKNHIQGSGLSKISIGLFVDERLLGVTIANSHHRQGHEDICVLNRLAFEDGIQVIGGASKMLKYLIKEIKLRNYKTLISWSDNRWSQGNVYKKIGFDLVGELPPDYSYCVGGGKRQSKQSNKKLLLLKKGAIGDMSHTETQLARTLGYNRIWDCGKKRWSITL